MGEMDYADNILIVINSFSNIIADIRLFSKLCWTRSWPYTSNIYLQIEKGRHDANNFLFPFIQFAPYEIVGISSKMMEHINKLSFPPDAFKVQYQD